MRLSAKHKRRIKRAILNSGVVTLVDKWVPPGIAILRYHSVKDHPHRYADSIGAQIIHETSVFERQMELVARRFDPVTMDDILLILRGARSMPRKPVAVTFDDGYADNLEIVVPVLARFGIQAAFYVTVSPVDAGISPWFCRVRHAFATTDRFPPIKGGWSDPDGDGVREELDERRAAFLEACERCARLAGETQDQAVRALERELQVEPLAPKESLMMNWEQVRMLHRAGHIVGSHSLTHPNLTHVHEQALRRELVDSRGRLEQELAAPVTHFAYPSPILQPHYNEQTIQDTREAGYRTAVTSSSGAVRPTDDPQALRRIAAPSEMDDFLWSLEVTLCGRR